MEKLRHVLGTVESTGEEVPNVVTLIERVDGYPLVGIPELLVVCYELIQFSVSS
jgi:hypothetical protein